jgi:hypothetical protein
MARIDDKEENFPGSIAVSAFYGGGDTAHTFIECDKCAQVWGFEGSDAEAGLVADGWTTEGQDICPDCNGVLTDSDGQPYHSNGCCDRNGPPPPRCDPTCGPEEHIAGCPNDE